MRSGVGGAPAAARMDPEAATELARKGVTLLLLDVPQHTVLGIDTQVIVRKWHAQEEILVKLSEEEEIRYSEAVKRFEFDDQLGSYNLDSLGNWKQLSNYLSQSVIERLEPIGGEITIALETSWIDRAPQTDMERRLMEQLKEDKFAKKVPAKPE